MTINIIRSFEAKNSAGHFMLLKIAAIASKGSSKSLIRIVI